MILYWCETDDHDEDWFVVASYAREARHFYEVVEGYGRGDARTTVICRIPRALTPKMRGWPEHDLLRTLGGVLLSESTPRIVQFKDRVYKGRGSRCRAATARR